MKANKLLLNPSEMLDLCIHHPEINSDTQRDVQLLMDQLQAERPEDVQDGLGRGRSMNLNKAVVTALGG